MPSKWIDKPTIAASELAAGDLVPVGDVSQAVGSRDATTTLQSLRQYLGAGVTVGVEQEAHGLSVGDVIRHNGTSYVQATADIADNAEAVGVVTSADTDTFTYQTTGLATGLSGLTAGELYYLQDNGTLGTTAGTVDKPILIAVAATAAVLILATAGASSGGGGNTYYDLNLGFYGAPGAGAVDTILVPRAVTIDDADPGEVHVGVNPTSAATIDVQVNGVSVGEIDITTGGVATWDLSADIELDSGDRLALVAPSPADDTLADVLVAFKGSAA